MRDPQVDELLRTAIENRRLVRLIYQGKERIVEPHDYGIQNGSPKLLAYQVGGSSSGKLPNWRWLRTELISKIYVLNEGFPGGRSIPSGKHHAWDKLFIRVKAADRDQIDVSDSQGNWDSTKLASAIAALGYPDSGN